MKKTAIILSAVLFGSIQAKAYDFELNGIYYAFMEGTTDEVAVSLFIDYWHDDFDGVGVYEGHIVIPETIIYENKQYRVTKIGFLAFGESNAESIVIPKSIRYIDWNAFRNYRATIKRIEVQWQTSLELNELEIEDDLSINYMYDIVLVVPANTKTLYQEHDVWKKFINIEETEFNVID